MDQQFKGLVMECNNCRLQFYASQLQVDPESDLMMCVNCLKIPGSSINILKDRPLKGIQPEPEETPLPRLQVVSKKRPLRAIQVPPGHSLFHCEKCRYEFSRRSSFSGSCPYCSEGRLRLLRSN
ncbi:MAG TPA: hypothetical protein VJH68_02415 [Candidatus Nanoarchaeia archaeon]|nr:hypothetical protein [Candidatus Nanoarchaeia archaeon]